jgi:hypothetical protein
VLLSPIDEAFSWLVYEAARTFDEIETYKRNK